MIGKLNILELLPGQDVRVNPPVGMPVSLTIVCLGNYLYYVEMFTSCCISGIGSKWISSNIKKIIFPYPYTVQN